MAQRSKLSEDRRGYGPRAAETVKKAQQMPTWSLGSHLLNIGELFSCIICWSLGTLVDLASIYGVDFATKGSHKNVQYEGQYTSRNVVYYHETVVIDCTMKYVVALI